MGVDYPLWWFAAQVQALVAVFAFSLCQYRCVFGEWRSCFAHRNLFVDEELEGSSIELEQTNTDSRLRRQELTLLKQDSTGSSLGSTDESNQLMSEDDTHSRLFSQPQGGSLTTK